MNQIEKFQYETLILRNSGYISNLAQEKIASARVLIAGCGIGSQAAESLVRLGFQNFRLVDGDTVDTHNLNRQFFFADQVGMKKAVALKENLLRINPNARVEAITNLLTEENAMSLVQGCDFVFDTIDFLDLAAIVALHDQALKVGLPVFSSFSVGFGAALLVLPPGGRSHSWIRDIFSLPATGPIAGTSYVGGFAQLFRSIAAHIDPVVVENMMRVFQSMQDGKPCPAPQVSPGAHAVATLASSAIIKWIENESMTQAPQLIIDSPLDALRSVGIKLVK